MTRDGLHSPDDVKDLKERLRQWRCKAEDNDDLWIQFIIYWMIFDGYLSRKYGTHKDCEKLQRFYDDADCDIKKSIQEYICCPEARQCIKNLNGLKGEVIKDENSIKEIFSVIYRVRCNLFHGAKTPDSPNDNDLVNCSLNILRPPISKWLE